MNIENNIQDIDKQEMLPRDYLGWLLFIFIIGAFTLFESGQLKIIGIFLAVSYILYFLKEKKDIPLEIIILCAWFAWSTTGFFVSVNADYFINTYKSVFQIVIMSFAIAGITATRGRIDINFLAILIGGSILMFHGITHEEFQTALDAEEKVRVGGGISANLFSWYLLICLFSLAYFWKFKTNAKWRISIIIFVLVDLTCIIYSGTRKSFIGSIVFIFACLWLCYRKEIRKKPYLVIVVIFLVIGLFFVTDYMVNNTLMGARFRHDIIEDPMTNRQHEGFSRMEYYKEGFNLVLNYPLFGVGLGNFIEYSYDSGESHSDFVEVLASTGIIGFLMHFSIYLLAWRRLSRIEKKSLNPNTSYTVGLLKAIIITTLIVALGRPNFSNQLAWVMMSSIIGYAWYTERNLVPSNKSSFCHFPSRYLNT